ncbi:hypothetical protein [Marinobacterium iners]|uniref:Uncharacterized protein n=1 Tax=Marinobacterium iners DSM 11526 TaxID=1122198 RepID=A0A1H3X702_9GAMM|nr:hypothetical protein [Marinobacterium iners]SDZ95187.1 hypothetical protein SAMN02745729_10161 [Marinobacterium iners DSM 11526]
MSRTLDEAWIDLRIKMREFDQLLGQKELPEGVYMHNTTMRVEQRFTDLLRQATLEIMEAASVVKAIGTDKTDL